MEVLVENHLKLTTTFLFYDNIPLIFFIQWIFILVEKSPIKYFLY